jgi:hypothetical protein
MIGALESHFISIFLSPHLHPFNSNSPEMHSLNPNWTIPQPPRPALGTRRRSSTLPSPTLLLETCSRRPERLRLALCGEELRLPEGRPSGAEKGTGCGHDDSSLLSTVFQYQSIDVCSGDG